MIPAVSFLNRSVSVSFDVTAYPVPNSLTFAFLGASAAKVSTPQTDYDGITLTGSCRQKGDKLYISTCIITVDNMTSSAAAGFYQVTVANGQGQALFTIQIKYNGQYNHKTFPAQLFRHLAIKLDCSCIVSCIFQNGRGENCFTVGCCSLWFVEGKEKE